MLYDEPSGITTTALAYCVTEGIIFYETRGIMNKEEYKENFLSLVDELVEVLYEGLENEQRK